jgi:peroxiredoxin Q/BCP
MVSSMSLLLTVVLASSLQGGGDLGAVMRPEPGEAAPRFSAEATTGGTVQLSDFRGQRRVILAFYPKAFTGG